MGKKVTVKDLNGAAPNECARLVKKIIKNKFKRSNQR